MERWFRELSQKQIRRGSFDSVEALLVAIEQYLATYNSNPTRFTWTKDADMILAKINWCKAALGTHTSLDVTKNLLRHAGCRALAGDRRPFTRLDRLLEAA